jgi:hypothetical protein
MKRKKKTPPKQLTGVGAVVAESEGVVAVEDRVSEEEQSPQSNHWPRGVFTEKPGRGAYEEHCLAQFSHWVQQSEE